MSPSKAIVILEERHEYLLVRAKVEDSAAKRAYIFAEAAALEIGIQSIAEDIAEYRGLRATRYALQQHLTESSC
jgi:hypothetical protein